ncbi:VanZ family protein [Lysinibacillus fusiformis]|nr:VanZ family protein [Lysinibacillus fusiformis]HCG4536176.1 VanZ family protein [Salmonella enterica subsp. enterica serovar Typhi str. AG3]
MFKTIMYIYIVLVLFVTLMPFTTPFVSLNHSFMETANFIPFRDLRLHYYGAIREILLNIIMMIPFGFLYPIINKKGVIKTVITTLYFSLNIEFFQLLSVWWGSIVIRRFDVTDLITNTFGGLIGYLMFVGLKRVVTKKIKGITYNTYS